MALHAFLTTLLNNPSLATPTLITAILTILFLLAWYPPTRHRVNVNSEPSPHTNTALPAPAPTRSQSPTALTLSLFLSLPQETQRELAPYYPSYAQFRELRRLSAGLIYRATPPPRAKMIKIPVVSAIFGCGHRYVEFAAPLKECELDAMGLMVVRHRRECHGCWVVGTLRDMGFGVRRRDWKGEGDVGKEWRAVGFEIGDGDVEGNGEGEGEVIVPWG